MKRIFILFTCAFIFFSAFPLTAFADEATSTEKRCYYYGNESYLPDAKTALENARAKVEEDGKTVYDNFIVYFRNNGYNVYFLSSVPEFYYNSNNKYYTMNYTMPVHRIVINTDGSFNVLHCDYDYSTYISYNFSASNPFFFCISAETNYNWSDPTPAIICYSSFEMVDTIPEPLPEQSTTQPTPDKEQLETSKGILGKLKDVAGYILDLPSKIAESITNAFSFLVDFIVNFFENLKDGLIAVFKLLFIPEGDPFEGTKNLIKSKFGFVFQLFDIVDFIFHTNFVDTPPDLTIKFDTSVSSSRLVKFLDGFTASALDWSIIEPYRQLIRNLITGIAWYRFIRKVQKRLPDVINGVSSSAGGE